MKVSLSRIQKSYGTQMVLNGAGLTVKSKEKIGLVGRNGCGKTTLLKIICQQEEPDSGHVVIANDTHVGYLSQITFYDQDNTVYEELLTAFDHVRQLEKELLKQADVLATDSSQAQLEKYDRMQNEFEMLNGYNYEVELKNVFFHFSFTEDDLNKPIREFSSGQKTRIALVKLLLSKPDVLLLDEPTNHLDVDSIEWLEGYVKAYPFAVIVVSHDRVFLDHVCDEIIEIDHGKTLRFPGNYTHYVQAKKEYIAKNHEAYLRQQQEIQRLTALIDKFHAKSSKAAFAKSKQKYLDRMDKIEDMQADQSQMRAHFTSARKGGNQVLEVEHLQVGYDHVLSTVDFQLRKGWRMAIIGPNGIGKSTLVKTLIQKIQPLHGTYHWGHQIDIGYFDQESAQMTSDKNVLDTLWEHDPMANQTEIRNILASFLFTEDEVFKDVNTLSGGERVRLALACLMLEHDNCLVLDEPTNHLDIPSKEALEDALMQYDGTLLFVSHDRMFLKKMADHVLEMGPKSHVYALSYDDYLAKKAQSDLVEEIQPQKQEKKESKVSFQDAKQLKNRVAKLETLLETAESELEELRNKRFEPEYYQDFRKMDQLNEKIDDKHNEIAHLEQEWEEKMALLEQVD